MKIAPQFNSCKTFLLKQFQNFIREEYKNKWSNLLKFIVCALISKTYKCFLLLCNENVQKQQNNGIDTDQNTAFLDNSRNNNATSIVVLYVR